MRILVVEDEKRIAQFIKRGLEEEHYAVDHVADGTSALEWAAAAEYDLIVLDVLLPGLKGSDVCRDLRARKYSGAILMLTALGSVEDRVTGLDAGADDYLVKPFDFAEFLARVRALLRRGSGAPATVLQVSDLKMDLLAHRVTRGSRTIELTAREYALLEFLMRHVGQALSRTQIVSHVWDHSFDSGTNVVDVYVRYLRKKVDDPFDVPLIQTIRGVGYKLEPLE